jgi:ribosomal-protein-alanine N-acetyltransferase
MPATSTSAATITKRTHSNAPSSDSRRGWRGSTTSQVVGWGGLQIDPFDPGWGVEVGYFFHPVHRRQGLASELVQASLAHGFDNLAIDEIYAYARPANTPSIGVIEKAGFRFVRYEPKLERNRYVITPVEWHQST